MLADEVDAMSKFSDLRRARHERAEMQERLASYDQEIARIEKSIDRLAPLLAKYRAMTLDDLRDHLSAAFEVHEEKRR